MKKHYTSSLGFEWSEYPDVQLDSKKKYDWNISMTRLELVLGFPLDFLKNKKVMEIGCGPGRFSEILIKFCKHLTLVDSSDAIKHNPTIYHENCLSFQKDFTDKDFIKDNKNKFDIVFCRGVIQHTENRAKAIYSYYDNPMSMKEINYVLANIGQNYYSADTNRCIIRCKRNEFFTPHSFEETKNGIRLIKKD